ncbi:MAG: protein-disulfide reductase DsbD domain-containing protein [Planctomycetota bacterium]
MRIEHDIFQTPHKVRLSLEDRATPPDYRSEQLGDTMPMWRVQTEGYTEGTGQLIGVVSRDQGFLDSPDVEWISSGVNSKNSRAVAIGRHGNFLHWGFAASPTFLTAEAKHVFVNCVHYIAKFQGKPPIARKKPGTAMRSYVTDALLSMSDASYAATVARYAQFAKDDAAAKAAIKARLAKGEAITNHERRTLGYPEPTPPGRFDRIRRYIPESDWPALREDSAKIRAYFDARLPYMRSTGWYELTTDEELRRFGVGNGDPTLIEKAIKALANSGQAEAAQNILRRYTDQSFETAAQWRAWWTQSSDRLFFTEAGGYKWLVDTTEEAAESAGISNAAAAADSAAAPRQQPGTPKKPNAPSPRQPLSAAMEIVRSHDGSLHAAVTLSIYDGWHAYLETPSGSANRVVELGLQLPASLKQDGEWSTDDGHPDKESPATILLDGMVQFRCKLSGTAKPGTKLACEIRYQVCNDESCNRPTSTHVDATMPAGLSSR